MTTPAIVPPPGVVPWGGATAADPLGMAQLERVIATPLGVFTLASRLSLPFYVSLLNQTMQIHKVAKEPYSRTPWGVSYECFIRLCEAGPRATVFSMAGMFYAMVGGGAQMGASWLFSKATSGVSDEVKKGRPYRYALRVVELTVYAPFNNMFMRIMAHDPCPSLWREPALEMGTNEGMAAIVHSEGFPALFKGLSFEIITAILNQELYAGMNALATRFGAETLVDMRQRVKKGNPKGRATIRDIVGVYAPRCAVNLAFGALVYPLRFVSTRLNVSGTNVYTEWRGPLLCAQHAVRDGGWGALYQGLMAQQLATLGMNFNIFLGELLETGPLSNLTS